MLSTDTFSVLHQPQYVLAAIQETHVLCYTSPSPSVWKYKKSSMSQGVDTETLAAAPQVSLYTVKASLNTVSLVPRLPAFRWHFLFFVIVSLSATSAFSTTFPLKSSSTIHPINVNGIPSKISDSARPVSTENATATTHPAIPTDSSNMIHPPPKREETSQTNDADDEKLQTPDDVKFKERVLASLRTVQNWETVEWIKDCRNVIPWGDLRNATGPYSRPEEDRLLADDANAIFLQRFCRWFPTIMTWVNTPPCVKCGCKECELSTVRGPETEEEIEGQAKRVEGKPISLKRHQRPLEVRPSHLFRRHYSVLLPRMQR
jgi:hypothetical protein